MRGLGVLGGELRDLQLTFADDGSAVQLPPLDDSFAKHVYVSRQHENAQEQSGLIKNLLVTMLPTCKVWVRVRVRVRVCKVRVRVRVRVRGFGFGLGLGFGTTKEPSPYPGAALDEGILCALGSR